VDYYSPAAVQDENTMTMAMAMKNANDRTPATFSASTIVVGDESLCGEMHLFLSVGSCSLLSSPWVIYIIIHIRVTPYYI